jgi:hypothetical protein
MFSFYQNRTNQQNRATTEREEASTRSLHEAFGERPMREPEQIHMQETMHRPAPMPEPPVRPVPLPEVVPPTLIERHVWESCPQGRVRNHTPNSTRPYDHLSSTERTAQVTGQDPVG